MATGSKELKRLEEFLDNLPNEPRRKIADKILWTVWARLHPEEAMTSSEMGMKISTIKLLSRPDMNLDKFEKTVEEMKKRLKERLDEKTRADKERFEREKGKVIETKPVPITMELIDDEPVEVEAFEVEPIDDDEEGKEENTGAPKKVVKRIPKKKAVRAKRTRKVKQVKKDPEEEGEGEEEGPDEKKPTGKEVGKETVDEVSEPDMPEPAEKTDDVRKPSARTVQKPIKKISKPVPKKVAKPARKKVIKPVVKRPTAGKKRVVKAKKVPKKD